MQEVHAGDDGGSSGGGGVGNGGEGGGRAGGGDRGGGSDGGGGVDGGRIGGAGGHGGNAGGGGGSCGGGGEGDFSTRQSEVQANPSHCSRRLVTVPWRSRLSAFPAEAALTTMLSKPQYAYVVACVEHDWENTETSGAPSTWCEAYIAASTDLVRSATSNAYAKPSFSSVSSPPMLLLMINVSAWLAITRKELFMCCNRYSPSRHFHRSPSGNAATHSGPSRAVAFTHSKTACVNSGSDFQLESGPGTVQSVHTSMSSHSGESRSPTTSTLAAAVGPSSSGT